MQDYLDAFSKYFDFSGRATRSSYWGFFLTNFLIYIVLNLISVNLITAIYSLAIFIPSISYATRRLHDTGRSGWWQLLSLIPVVGVIVVIVFLALPAEGDNKYGEAPSKDDSANNS